MGGTEARRPAEGYRTSHLEKGDEYDAAIESAAFDAYQARLEREHLVRLLPSLFPQGIVRYLDFACGTGRITSVVAGFADTSIGVDVSPSMLERARAKCPDTEFVLQDITRDALRIEPVDLVTSFRFLGNAESELRISALQAIHALLAPGGYLIVNNHRNPSSIHNRLLRLRRRTDGSDLTLSTLRALLRQTGFETVAVHGIGGWIVRYGLQRRDLLDSSWAPRLERMSRVPGVARYCPDMVVVGRRV